MYKTEIERFNKKIDEAQITQKSKRTLRDLIEEFFSVNYTNISEKRKEIIELDFKKRCIVSLVGIDRIDSDKVQAIFNQIETSLFTILDKEVNKMEKTWWEKILSSIKIPLHFHR